MTAGVAAQSTQRARRVGLALVVAWAIVVALACAATASADDGAPAIELAPGVFMVRGSGGVAEPANGGRIGNSGFIVGDGGVIAIDTGTSYRDGRALLARIAQTTDKPVRLALITHVQPEFLFGANAFRERGIPIRMHSKAASLMAARCEHCLKNLKLALGDEAMAGTTMFEPDQVFDQTHTLAQWGRAVRVIYFGHSSGPGDVAVLDETSGVLFAGGLLDEHRVPDVQDSDLAGWSTALTRLRELPARRIVPGHGSVTTRAAIDAVARYLADLQTRVAGLLNAGAGLSEAPDAAGLPDFATWDQYDTIHRRNASIVYIRLERELLYK
ncbi:MAG TPA: MBL fold metallo-hydrolase [Burkholderiaceae bacterium]|nr:MBL fold metallo-hydrolase [Burkholderiaceae bacterium]